MIQYDLHLISSVGAQAVTGAEFSRITTLHQRRDGMNIITGDKGGYINMLFGEYNYLTTRQATLSFSKADNCVNIKQKSSQGLYGACFCGSDLPELGLGSERGGSGN